jgi:hypothetical protein
MPGPALSGIAECDPQTDFVTLPLELMDLARCMVAVAGASAHPLQTGVTVSSKSAWWPSLS